MATTREVDGKSLGHGLYRHKKSGGLYTVLGLIRHHETGHAMVVYYSHGHGSVSTRPLWGFEGARCSDPDGFLGTPTGPFERFEAVTLPNQPTEHWVCNTLCRNFDLFETALQGVSKRERRAPEGTVRIARALYLLEVLATQISAGSLRSDVIDGLASIRKELAGELASESVDVGGSPNTSGGAMDPESSLGRL